MTRTDIENQRVADAYSVRRDLKVKQMLLDLEQQIMATIGNICVGSGEFDREQMALALSDRELLTLNLWTEETDTVISGEIERRRAEYEKFTSRLAEPGES